MTDAHSYSIFPFFQKAILSDVRVLMRLAQSNYNLAYKCVGDPEKWTIIKTALTNDCDKCQKDECDGNTTKQQSEKTAKAECIQYSFS